MTQELIANMLGVRRRELRRQPLKLQEAKLIDYRRASVTMLDHDGVKKRACESYRVVKNEYDRLLPTQFRLRLSKRLRGRLGLGQTLTKPPLQNAGMNKCSSLI